jgi:hypothetical protein
MKIECTVNERLLSLCVYATIYAFTTNKEDRDIITPGVKMLSQSNDRLCHQLKFYNNIEGFGLRG